MESHPAVLDGFVNDFRKAQAELKLFTGSQCDDMTGQNLEGKVLVMSPFTLKESCWAPENQLWLATGGFWLRPPPPQAERYTPPVLAMESRHAGTAATLSAFSGRSICPTGPESGWSNSGRNRPPVSK